MKNPKGDSLDSLSRLELAFSSVASNVWGGLRDSRPGNIYAVYLRCKAGGIWTAVAKRYEAGTGEAQVAFGQGASFFKAIVELNKSIAAGRWRVDRPWRPGG